MYDIITNRPRRGRSEQVTMMVIYMVMIMRDEVGCLDLDVREEQADRES